MLKRNISDYSFNFMLNLIAITLKTKKPDHLTTIRFLKATVYLITNLELRIQNDFYVFQVNPHLYSICHLRYLFR